jgi:hypothetical protein
MIDLGPHHALPTFRTTATRPPKVVAKVHRVGRQGGPHVAARTYVLANAR